MRSRFMWVACLLGLLSLCLGSLLGGGLVWFTRGLPLKNQLSALGIEHEELRATFQALHGVVEAQALELAALGEAGQRFNADLATEAEGRRSLEGSLATLRSDLEQLRKSLPPPLEPEVPPAAPPSTVKNSVGIELQLVPFGNFVRSDGRRSLKREVKLSKPYYLGATEVSAAQWEKVMNAPPPFGKVRQPAGGVRWEEAFRFCQKLNELPDEKKVGRRYRLPTEAEWEHACRAGTASVFGFGDDQGLLDEHGWFTGNSAEMTHEVAERKPNRWGFHDMHGNVWEWCADWFDPNIDAQPLAIDPCGPPVGYRRVCKGGCYSSQAADCSSARRERYVPWDSIACVGFRIAMDVPGDEGAHELEPTDPEPAIGAHAHRAHAIFHNSIGIEMKEVPRGEFVTGDPQLKKEKARAREVVISKPFFLSVYEITNGQWEQLMKKPPPGKDRSPELPVTGLTWDESLEFCAQLSKLPEEQLFGRTYRLPTEAEWEYACRAGTKTTFSFGENDQLLDDYAWHGGNAENMLHPVGFKKPNAWGFYDMHGNAAEWCQDFFAPYPSPLGKKFNDPKGPPTGNQRVFRGGSWAGENIIHYASASRSKRPPDKILEGILGFRIAVDVGAVNQPKDSPADGTSATVPGLMSDS